MNQINLYTNKKIAKSKVRDALKEANKCIDDNNFELNSSHPANKTFKVENGFSNNHLLEIFKSIEITDFCHAEIDSALPTEILYCFKLYREFSEDLKSVLKVICEEEVMMKFKLREYSDKKLFIMTIHYPDPTKDPWTYIWKEN